jgi:hypothetical protein
LHDVIRFNKDYGAVVDFILKKFAQHIQIIRHPLRMANYDILIQGDFHLFTGAYFRKTQRVDFQKSGGKVSGVLLK